jgi:hypothetical protein
VLSMEMLRFEGVLRMARSPRVQVDWKRERVLEPLHSAGHRAG